MYSDPFADSYSSYGSGYSSYDSSYSSYGTSDSLFDDYSTQSSSKKTSRRRR